MVSVESTSYVLEDGTVIQEGDTVRISGEGEGQSEYTFMVHVLKERSEHVLLFGGSKWRADNKHYRAFKAVEPTRLKRRLRTAEEERRHRGLDRG